MKNKYLSNASMFLMAVLLMFGHVESNAGVSDYEREYVGYILRNEVGGGVLKSRCKRLDYPCVLTRLVQANYYIGEGEVKDILLAVSYINFAAHYYKLNSSECPIVFDYVSLKLLLDDLDGGANRFGERSDYFQWVRLRGRKYVNKDFGGCGSFYGLEQLKSAYMNGYCKQFEC